MESPQGRTQCGDTGEGRWEGGGRNLFFFTSFFPWAFKNQFLISRSWDINILGVEKGPLKS